MDKTYFTFAASQTDAAIGGNTAKGDIIAHVLIVPLTTSPGQVSIKDGGGSAIVLFQGGASSVVELKAHTVELHMRSKVGPWTITTGANVQVVVVGKFL